MTIIATAVFLSAAVGAGLALSWRPAFLAGAVAAGPRGLLAAKKDRPLASGVIEQ